MHGLNLLFSTAIWFTAFTNFSFAGESVEANGKIKYADETYMVISVDDNPEKPSQPQDQITFQWISSAGHVINAKSGIMDFNTRGGQGTHEVTLTVTSTSGASHSTVRSVCIGPQCADNPGNGNTNPGGGTTTPPDSTSQSCHIVADIAEYNRYGITENVIELNKDFEFSIEAYLKNCPKTYSVMLQKQYDSSSRILLTNTYGFEVGKYELLIVDEDNNVQFEDSKKTIIIRDEDGTTGNQGNPNLGTVDLRAELNVFPSEICPNSSVKLDSTASTPSDQIRSYTIKNIDSGTSVSGDITYMPFYKEGKKTLELMVFGENGGSDTDQKTVTVLPKDHPSCSVTACFKATLSSPTGVVIDEKKKVTRESKLIHEEAEVPFSLGGNVAKGQQLELEVDASCSTGTIISHEWEFNGANEGVDQKPGAIDVNHEGENIIRLIVTGDNNTSDKVSLPINISKLKADFAIDGNKVKEVTESDDEDEKSEEFCSRNIGEFLLEDISDYDPRRVTPKFEILFDSGDDDCHDNPPIDDTEDKKVKMISSLSFGANCNYYITHKITDYYGIFSEKVVKMELHNNCGKQVKVEFFGNEERNDSNVFYPRGSQVVSELHVNLDESTIDCDGDYNLENDIEQAELWVFIHSPEQRLLYFFSQDTNEFVDGLKVEQQAFMNSPLPSLMRLDLLSERLNVVINSESGIKTGYYDFYALLVKKDQKVFKESSNGLIDVEALQIPLADNFVNDTLCTISGETYELQKVNVFNE